MLKAKEVFFHANWSVNYRTARCKERWRQTCKFTYWSSWSSRKQKKNWFVLARWQTKHLIYGKTSEISHNIHVCTHIHKMLHQTIEFSNFGLCVYRRRALSLGLAGSIHAFRLFALLVTHSAYYFPEDRDCFITVSSWLCKTMKSLSAVYSCKIFFHPVWAVSCWILALKLLCFGG